MLTRGWTLATSLAWLAASAAVLVVAGRVQEPFASKKYDDGLFVPLEDLGVLSTSGFTSLGHPLFPDYNVRIKKSDFCDGTVNAFTGYIDIQARHIFFYFFESRNDPDKDDVIFWTNGGPGCASSIGLFMELGPCRITKANETTFNPYSWNEKANIFFIDQPVGAGFSYADYGEYVSTTKEAAVDIGAFVTIFFEHFSKFKGRAFHMAGESYGGRSVPEYASYIYDMNPRLIEAGATPINLKSIMLGNGCTTQIVMFPTFYEMQCKAKSVPPVSTISDCVAMKQAMPRCLKWLQESCVDMMDTINCNAAISFCIENVQWPYRKTGRNLYDISEPCEGEIEDTLCYPLTKNIATFLDRPDIRQTIGVDPKLTSNYSECNAPVVQRFRESMDWVFPAEYFISALLERGVRALIYVGANDWICNWVGNERMALGLEWTGQKDFVAQPLRDWTVEGEVAGKTRSAGPLTFATIYGAGHMAPYNKPKEALELVSRWIAGEDL